VIHRHASSMNLLSFFGDKPFTQLKINQIERENIGVEIVW